MIFIGPNQDQTSVEVEIVAACDSFLGGVPEFTIDLLHMDSRATFHYRKGGVRPLRSSQNSASKLVQACVLLYQVSKDILSLDDKIIDLVPGLFLTPQTAVLTVRDCLAFSSGYTNGSCRQADNGLWESCLLAYPDITNGGVFDSGNGSQPGTDGSFVYSTVNPDFFGLAVCYAGNFFDVNGDPDWSQAFDDFRINGFPAFSLVTQGSDRKPSGVVSTTGPEYIALLEAIFTRSFLTPELCDLLMTDLIPYQTTPLATGSTTWHGKDNHWAGGLWLDHDLESEPLWVPGAPVHQMYTAGIAGQYNLINVRHRYYVAIGFMGSSYFPGGYQLYHDNIEIFTKWAVA